MFHLIGRKKRIVKYYPEPKYDTIIEPFAGSASYALHYHNKNVILYEKDPVLYGIWTYIIHKATPSRILELPLLKVGDNINDRKFEKYKLLQEEKDLIGYFLNTAIARPARSPSPCPTFSKWNLVYREKLSNDILKVKHWAIYNKSYETARNIKATWFIDPPYQGNGGKYYRCSNKDINYTKLAKWVLERKGQIIVCENEEANWLPFRPLIYQSQQGRDHTEMIY